MTLFLSVTTARMKGFPGGSVVKKLPANAGATGDTDSILGSERSPRGRNGNPLQYSCLEKSHGQRNLIGYSPCDRKESDTIERQHARMCS